MEFVCVIGIFLAFITASVYSTMREINSEKKASKWAFHVPTANDQEAINPIEQAFKFTTQIQTSKTTPEIELSDYTDVYLTAKNEADNFVEVAEFTSNIDVADFQHSEINTAVMESIDSLIKSVNDEVEQGNDTSMSESIFEAIKTQIGQNVAKLVTNSYSNLIENKEAVVVGLYCDKSNTLSFLDEVLTLTGNESIVSGEEDFVLIKGMLLPSKEFRVLHHEDADTVEIGYGNEQFIINKVA